MAAKKAPAKKATPAKKAAPKQDGRMRNRTDRYGSSGMGQTESGVNRNYTARQEAVGRAALKAISGKKPYKNESLAGSEHSVIRSEALKGLNLTKAQVEYVESQMMKVPFRPTAPGRRKKK